MPDITLACSDCGTDFVWQVADQRYYHTQGWEPPKRCPACRAQRKAGRDRPAVALFVPLLVVLAVGAGGVLIITGVAKSLLIWLAGINLLTLAAYGYDKAIAGSGRRRVPERVLLSLALCGGSLAALLAMHVFHHKTRKRSFLLPLGAIVALHLLALAVWAGYRR